MAKRKEIKEQASVAEIPPEVVGAVVLADLAQIEADASRFCQDGDAQNRIIRAVQRLREIATVELSPTTLGTLGAVGELLAAASAPDSLAVSA